MRALIGSTGFVGSSLLRAGGYDAAYNSRNIDDIAGRDFDEIVCAGVSAVKWLANREPEADRAAITRLTNALKQANTTRFVLISTVDVYPDPAVDADEGQDLGRGPDHAYGRHRLTLEHWVAQRWTDHMILRLPALFGPGLKKNVLYDLLHDNLVERIDPAAEFQWYPLERLPVDLTRATAAQLRVANLVTAPLRTSMLVDHLFPAACVAAPGAAPARYRLRTRHAKIFGGAGPYLMQAEEVLRDIGRFVAGHVGTAA
jgi:hypothetical protein